MTARERIKRAWSRRPENVYRDVWLFLVTLLVFLALNGERSQQDDLQGVVDQNSAIAGQLCMVVINVHDASVSRLVAEQNRLIQSLNYVRNATERERATGIPERVRANLPAQRADVKAAKQSELATRAPPECVTRLADQNG